MPPAVPRAGKQPGPGSGEPRSFSLRIFFFLSVCRPLSSAACLAFVAGERWPLIPPCFYSLPFGDQPRLNYNLSASPSFPGEIGLLWVTHQSAAVRGQGNTVFSLQVPGQAPCEESEMAHKGATRPPLSPLTLLAATQATSRYWSIVAFMGLGEADSKIRRSETQIGRVSTGRVSCQKCIPEQIGISAYLPEYYPHFQIVDRDNGKFEAAGLRFHRFGSFLLTK